MRPGRGALQALCLVEISEVSLRTAAEATRIVLVKLFFWSFYFSFPAPQRADTEIGVPWLRFRNGASVRRKIIRVNFRLRHAAPRRAASIRS
jgi:hypothetical protein